MKKVVLTLLAVIASTWVCLLSASGDTFELLKGATTTGAGKVVDVSYAEFRSWSCDVLVSDSTATAVKVRIEGNQGGSLFAPGGMAEYTLTVPELAAGIGSFSITDIPVNVIRANLVTLTGGSSPAVTVKCTGVK
ncbi:secreted protein [Candidatus Magnetobacterium bavaricum]|uniref:Secreted protein n=1 Tax=Candidatus Magnetobacterium bavaricum TaxID=29290 RepID=A0A0F3GZE5_9BACT|nr:secreted protein [Candidatus Magnetobacterium bavaricum]